MSELNLISSHFIYFKDQLLSYTQQSKKYLTVLLFSIIAFQGISKAQSFNCPDPARCVSKDLEVVDAYIEGVDQCFTCTPGTTITRKLFVSIHNKTGSERTSFAVFGTLKGGTFNSGGTAVSFCVGPVPPNSTITREAGTITFVCGTELTLNNVFEAWTSAAETHNSCEEILADACASIAPKCGTVSQLVIRTPLSVAASSSVIPCKGTKTGSITFVATGGTAPYTYTLSGGTLTSSVTNTTGVFTGLGTGTYTISVKDAKGCVATNTYTLPDKICCEFKVTCPTKTDLGKFNCTNLNTIPAKPTTVAALKAAPYNIIIGDLPCGKIAFKVYDNATPNVCSKANQTITRTITIWDDLNANNTLDAGEKSATCTFTFTIEADLTAPSITCPAAVTVQCYKDVPAPDVTKVTASDNCGKVTVTFVSDVAYGTCPKVITRTYKATDRCGNYSTCTQTITVKDITPPVIYCGANKTITCPATVVFDKPTATDNCGGTVTITIVSTTVTGNVSTRTWKATDACGNSSTCSQSITVKNVPHIFPTNTSCYDFTSGTTQPLAQVCYQKKGTNYISNATPGVFFYYTTIVSPITGTLCVDLVQTSCTNFKYFSLLQNQLIAFNYSNCTKLSYTVTKTADGQYRICINGVTAGQKIVLSAKYDVKSIIGSNLGTTSPNCTYTFTSKVNGVEDPCSRGSILVTANCTSTATSTQLTQNVSNEKVSEETTGTLSVHAYPNPYTDKVKFVIESPVSGQGSLDLYNTLGQKVKIVYQGYIHSGRGQTIEYTVPELHRTNLVYRLQVGNYQTTGKLIHPN